MYRTACQADADFRHNEQRRNDDLGRGIQEKKKVRTDSDRKDDMHVACHGQVKAGDVMERCGIDGGTR